ncbi:MAG TPA: putative glycoside hydrolase [Bacillota bacterium]|nr:putative glycoside hydrolase [Bacillota bacterium]
MEKKQHSIFHIMGILLLGIAIAGINPYQSSGEEVHKASSHSEIETAMELIDTSKPMARFTYDSGLSFEYPDAVRGIYVTGPSAGGERFNSLVDLVETTDLNAMVIDIKEDHGEVTVKLDEDSPYADVSRNYIHDPRKLLETLEEKGIYPIARIVVFKDTLLAEKHPEWSFTQNGKVWTNGKGEGFVSPYQKEVWEYNVELAKQAAEWGFQEIQFDYVRFPEGFETRDEDLEYDRGDFKDFDGNNIKRRVAAVTGFVEYAKNELDYYGVDMAVDIFGYTATIEEAPGIGQNFLQIADNVDVISSMIYPSHWTSYFGIEFPDKEPYKLVTEYAKKENELLGQLDVPPTTRPWIQDFDAPWLYSGEPTFHYGKKEVEAQIKALNENGIDEFLLWNSGNVFTEGVDYTPLD